MKNYQSQHIPFTIEAYEKLEADIARLTKQREEVMVRLKIAREQGDLSENGAYTYAKFELGSIGRQLRHLHFLHRNVDVVEKQPGNEVVSFGSEVTVESNGKQMVFCMVTKHESNPLENKLSIESPIGSGLMGKKKGDTVTITIPAGEVVYTIVNVT